MNQQKISGGTRLGAMFLDHAIMTGVCMVFALPGMVMSFVRAFQVTHEPSGGIFIGGPYIVLIGFALYFCKDCLNGRSPAKRILKLQVVNNKTGQAASPLRCFVRDIFCIIWPIEAIIALANPERRLGDRVAGTRLTYFDSSAIAARPKWGQFVLAFILAYGFMLLFLIPFSAWPLFPSNDIPYVESSYNAKGSMALQKLYSDSLSDYLVADIRIYDSTKILKLKYISGIFRLRRDYFSNDEDYAHIRSKAENLLYTTYPAGSFVGEFKFVYKADGSMQIRSYKLEENIKQ